VPKVAYFAPEWVAYFSPEWVAYFAPEYWHTLVRIIHQKQNYKENQKPIMAIKSA
jgi:hypothetical protein